MIKKFIVVLLVIAFAAVSFAAEESANPIADNVKKLVGANKAKAPKITPDELKAMIDGKKEFVLLDVRTGGEVAAVKIYADNYVAISRDMVEFKFPPKHKAADEAIVVYCKAGGRGALVTNRLIEIGYTNVVNLDGGIKAWMAKGYEVENMMGTFKEVQF